MARPSPAGPKTLRMAGAVGTFFRRSLQPLVPSALWRRSIATTSRRISLTAAILLIAFAAHAAIAATAAKSKPIDPANMDPSVKPGVDFYRYANGKWLEKNPIPPSESRWGAFSELIERNSQVLYEILESAAKQTGAPKGSALQMVGDFYATAIDSAKADAEGATPLADEMSKIAAIKTATDLQDAFAHLQTVGVRVPFAVFAAQDAKASTEVILQTSQSGLGLPDRDYYTKTDDASQKLRDQYVAHVSKMFKLAGDDQATSDANAKTVLGIETQLANAPLTRARRRDPEATYR